MAFDLAAWALLVVVGYSAGARVLTLLGAEQLRPGDRFIIGTWIGIALAALLLLAASLFGPVSPRVSLGIGAAFTVLAIGARRRPHHIGNSAHVPPEAPVPAAAVIMGALLAAIGAAALTSDPVTLYDSLVYHVGIIGWLREHGTVPGLALIHNRLGHVSPWFALGAAFDAGVTTNRGANVPLGFAMVMVAVQGAIAVARIASRRGTESDWFLALTTAALVWTGVVSNAASPSPDVVTNVLIVLVAWSMLVVPRASVARRHAGWRRWFTPRLLPFILAIAASGMKMFAIPAAVAAALFYTFGRTYDGGARDAIVRAGVSVALGAILLTPFFAANLVASGCPLFPSRIGCVAAGWSIGPLQAADYAEYIRNVARWESRRSVSGAAELPWVGPWIGAHPVLTTLAVLVLPLAIALLRGPRRDGVRSALLLAVLGIAFVGSQAPAPRFLFAFVLVAPVVALAYPLSALSKHALTSHDANGSMRRAASVAFVASALVMGLGYALASQKLNVRSAVLNQRSALRADAADFVVPALPKAPTHLYVWRLNDFELVTPVPRPIADTLGFHSAIGDNTSYEKCSTAPLPCTPYIPSGDVRLRVPRRGVSGGFVRLANGNAGTVTRAQCIGEIDGATTYPAPPTRITPAIGAVQHCGETDRR
jgi:hypothetical protein